MSKNIKPLVSLEKVDKTYLDRGLPVQALRQIDLQVERGEFTCLAGPSGSGKTTLLNIIGCLDRPTAGEVAVLAEKTAPMSRTRLAGLRSRTFGFVFQTYNLIPVLTAYENVEYVLLLQGVRRSDRQQRVMNALAGVKLAGLAEKRPGQLSGGQQQRVAVARAIVGQPELVLADEPTANLDSVTAAELIDLLRQLNTTFNTTFLFSSHDPAVIEQADRIIQMRDGCILENG